MDGWNSEKFQLWATIELDQGQTVTLDVIRASGHSAVNDIPRCSIDVALGRRVDNNAASPIHQILDQLKVKRKVKVYVQAKTLGFFGLFGFNFWPKEPFLLFEGYTCGSGYTRAPNSAAYTLECEHWLADLAYAPATSGISSPMNPSQMTFTALTAPPAESAGGTATTGHYTGITSAEAFINAGTIGSDFWGEAIHKFFKGLSEMETLVDSHVASKVGLDLDPLPGGNVPAQNALKRFEPDAGATYGKKLKFDPGAYGGDLEEVADQIEIAMGSETLEVMSGNTLWDKLIQYAGTYMFAVIPMVERALVVPFVPGLRTPYVTISAGEYEFGKLSGDMPRVLRGVGIYGGKNFEAGSEQTGDDAVDYDQFAIGGYFQGAKTGQILFKQAPMWMSTLNLSSEVDRASGGGGAPRADALNPGEGAAPGKDPPKKKAEANGRLMNAFAETMYVYEVLKFRMGDMSGKFRVDIGPGSIVKVEGCGEKFLGVDDKFGQTLFATVLQLNWFLDAESPRAGTSFHLAHVRNELENTTDGFSLDKHPIWSEAWTGCPLQKI
jgi:hypothetical protein